MSTELIEELSDRQRTILSVVVQEYVETAQPVGSRVIADKYGLGVSPATIRNDLATLEKAGLLTHPHTSAGRIPTDAGYRYFVRHLLSNVSLPVPERRMIRHQFHQARQEIDQWLRLSTAVLARTSNAASLATLPRAIEARVKHLELIGIRDGVVLLVLVLQEGTVKQQLITLETDLEQDELSRISNELNESIKGLGGIEIEATLESLSPLANEMGALVAEMLAQMEGQLGERIYRDGLAEMLSAPEFIEGDNVRRVVQIFEKRSMLEEILDQLLEIEDVQVLIAGEGRFDELEDISLVIGRYGVGDRVTGLLGVIGPVRMPYGRTIGAVRYVSTLMSDLMLQIYGS